MGEVGLGGEVRQVSSIQRRLVEAQRFGFTRAIVPAGSPDGPSGIELFRVGMLDEALRLLGGRRRAPAVVEARGGFVEADDR